MLGLKKHGPDGRYGAIMDIGSGSVGVALVVSDPMEKDPIIIWSHRERMVNRDHTDLAAAEKDITTTLINASLELSSAGLKVLRQYDPKGTVEEFIVNISAPWSYTVARTATINADHPFTVTKKLVSEMVEKATAVAHTAIKATRISEKFDIEIVSNATVSMTANGYKTSDPYDSEVRKLTLSQLVGVSQLKILHAVNDVQQKILPKTELTTNTFMYVYYRTITELIPEVVEVCLVDITAEGTELGVIREGVLNHTSHISTGIYTLAREISLLIDIPREEALGYFKDTASDITKNLSASKKKKIDELLQNYQESLVELFHQTGDTLSIPKTVFLHTDNSTEEFFANQIKTATRAATNTSHAVHFINSEFFNSVTANDTALLLSAYVFHKKLHCTKYGES